MSRIYGLSSFKQYRINGKLLTIIGEYHKSLDKIIKCGSDISVPELIRMLNGNIALEYNPRLKLDDIFLESWNLMEIIKLYKKRKIIGFDIRSDFLEWFKIYDENDSINITTIDYLLSKNSPVNLTRIPEFDNINYSKTNSDLLNLIKNILTDKLNSIKVNEIPKLYIYKDSKNLTIKAAGQEHLILLLREFFAQLIDYYLLIQILTNVNENWIILVGEQHSNALQFIFKKYLNIDPIFIGKKIGPDCFDIKGFNYK